MPRTGARANALQSTQSPASPKHPAWVSLAARRSRIYDGEGVREDLRTTSEDR
jgi:hypothetical protein